MESVKWSKNRTSQDKNKEGKKKKAMKPTVKKKKKTLPSAEYTNPAEVALLVLELGRLNISMLHSEYKKKYFKSLSHTGKLQKFIESIPNVKMEQVDGVSFLVCNHPMNIPKRAFTAPNIVTDVIDGAVDGTADIISFQESIGLKAVLADEIPVIEDTEQYMDMTSPDEYISSFFGLQIAEDIEKPNRKKYSLIDSTRVDDFVEVALIGNLLPTNFHPISEPVFLNVHEPFCFAAVGVQGAGKSHTSACILESCLTPFESGNVVKLKAPMTSLILHYDQNTSSICESAGLLKPNPALKAGMDSLGMNVNHVPQDKAVILVSPSFYHHRKKFYGTYCTVKPLLFRWKSLTADHIKRIMRIESGDNQLYVASFLDLLRNYQRKALVPDFPSFLKEVKSVCNLKGQSGPLDQRIALLESIVAESEKNISLVNESADLISSFKDGKYFTIADLTDPLLSKEEANGLFQVLTEQFRTIPTKEGKVLFLDEAHKYMNGVAGDGLSEAIVNVARLMRHDGMRLIVSTQSPKALAPELLELVTVGCLHHFHSPDWWAYLKSKLPLNDDAWESILSLVPGEAVIFASSHSLPVDNTEGSHCLPIRIRPRITDDLGKSRRNNS